MVDLSSLLGDEDLRRRYGTPTLDRAWDYVRRGKVLSCTHEVDADGDLDIRGTVAGSTSAPYVVTLSVGRRRRGRVGLRPLQLPGGRGLQARARAAAHRPRRAAPQRRRRPSGAGSGSCPRCSTSSTTGPSEPRPGRRPAAGAAGRPQAADPVHAATAAGRRRGAERPRDAADAAAARAAPATTGCAPGSPGPTSPTSTGTATRRRRWPCSTTCWRRTAPRSRQLYFGADGNSRSGSFGPDEVALLQPSRRRRACRWSPGPGLTARRARRAGDAAARRQRGARRATPGCGSGCRSTRSGTPPPTSTCWARAATPSRCGRADGRRAGR